MPTERSRRPRSVEPLHVRPGRPEIGLVLPRGARLRVSAGLFRRLCRENGDLRLERTATGGLIVMAPAGAESGGRNADLTGQLWLWNRTAGAGKVFDSSSGFALANGAIRSPDAAWIALDRWGAIPAAARGRFAPLSPDFVAELRSPGDRLGPLRGKMAEYVAQGARLGWLIDPTRGAVEVYRPGRAAEVLLRPASLDGGDVLPGFVLDLRDILGA